MRKIYCFISILLVFSLSLAQINISAIAVKAATTTYTSGDYTYTLNSNNNATITAYSGNGGAVVVPSELDGYTVTEIGNYAFNKCTALTSIELPDGITAIGHDAFAYTSLTNLVLPSEVTSIGYSIIYGVENITQITIPKNVETMNAHSGNGDGPFAGSYIKEVTFENGISQIPANAMRNCSTLEKVNIPNTVTEIGNYAFNRCSSLLSVRLANNITSIGKNTFSGCDSLIAYCNYYTKNVISCINQKVSFVPSDEKFVDNENLMLDRKKSYFYANMDSVSASGYLSMNITFGVKDKWEGELSNQKIVTYIPQYTELLEDSIKLNGQLISDYTYNESSRQLAIPVNADAGAISYSIKINSKENVLSYAYLSAQKAGATSIENIDAINESFDGITLNVPSTISSDIVKVSGVAPISTEIELYVNGNKQGSVTSLKNGSWTSDVTISHPTDCYPNIIEAKCIDEYGADISVSKTIYYIDNAPTLTNLELEYNEHNVIKSFDLMNMNGVKPLVYFLPNSTFTFKAEFENRENIENVYITSTRNNVKKSMEAIYDPATNQYIASGYFDETNTSYVPGIIGVEYTEKNKTVEVSEEFDMSSYQTIISDEMDKANVEYEMNTDEEVQATIDLSNVLTGMNKAIIKAGVKYVDTSGFTSLEEVYEFCGMKDKLINYTVEGVDGQSYVLSMDFSDSDNVAMLIYDTYDVGSTLANKVITLNLDMSEFGSEEYMKWFDANEKLGNFSTAASFAYKTYGIYSDYNDLVNEIDKSSTIADKFAAKQKALELRQDQMAFLALTMTMPLLVAGSTMTAPALAFSVLLGAMTTVSGTFYDMRLAQIKGQTFKINWAIDPSGYVYDAKSGERLENVTVSAYYIPYDESDNFWENIPSKDEYGSIWEAAEYEQENPLQTNVDGKYAWDVPEGWWRVKCEKEGYKTEWSEWMTVPPVQTEVNIAMIKEGKIEDNSNNNVGNTSNKNDNVNNVKSSNGDILSESVKTPSKTITKPKKVSLSSIKNSKKKSFTLKWKKINDVSGYQVQYALNKKITKSKKTKNVKKTTLTVKKLKKGKTYYVRVRAYKIDSSGKKVYGKWSNVKKIKIKK